MRIKKGDQVLIILGKDRGKKGKVLESFPKKRRVLVEGINMRKRHQKPRKQGEKGQIIELPTSLDVSDVKLVCSKCGKAARISYKTEGDRKYRACKKCGQEI